MLLCFTSLSIYLNHPSSLLYSPSLSLILSLLQSLSISPLSLPLLADPQLSGRGSEQAEQVSSMCSNLASLSLLCLLSYERTYTICVSLARSLLLPPSDISRQRGKEERGQERKGEGARERERVGTL